jgi:hypothetical protein
MKASSQDIPEHRDYEWGKDEVGTMPATRSVVKIAMHSEGDPPEAPIVAIIQRVANMAQSNWP